MRCFIHGFSQINTDSLATNLRIWRIYEFMTTTNFQLQIYEFGEFTNYYDCILNS
jgi:hypothetical protein